MIDSGNEESAADVVQQHHHSMPDWDIHQMVSNLQAIPNALESSIDDTNHNNSLQAVGHAHNDIRRALRQLDRDLGLLEQRMDEPTAIVDVEMENANDKQSSPVLREIPEAEKVKEDDVDMRDSGNDYVAQTQGSFDSAPSLHLNGEGVQTLSTGSSKNQRNDNTTTIFKSELRKDLLFLLTQLNLAGQVDEATQHLVVSVLGRISKIWIGAYPAIGQELDFATHLTPLLRRIFSTPNSLIRAQLPQLHVVNHYLLNVRSCHSKPQSTCPPDHVWVVLMSLHDFSQGLLTPQPHLDTELDLEQYRCCVGLLRLLLDTFRQHRSEELELVCWIEQQCQHQMVHQSFSNDVRANVVRLENFLTNTALDALDDKADYSLVLAELAANYLEQAILFDASLIESADRLWKTVAMFNWPADESQNPDDLLGYEFAALSAQLASIVVCGNSLDPSRQSTSPSRTATISLQRCVQYPQLLESSPAWWSVVDRHDLQGEVLRLLHLSSVCSRAVAERIIDECLPPPPAPEDLTLSLDLLFWQTVQRVAADILEKQMKKQSQVESCGGTTGEDDGLCLAGCSRPSRDLQLPAMRRLQLLSSTYQ